MKSILFTITLATLVVIAPLTQAHAQNHGTSINVPFAFNCGSTHFAAGAYKMKITGNLDQILTVTDDKHTAMVGVEKGSDSDSPNAAPYLAFRKYGSQYFLAEYHAGAGVTVAIPESPRERRLARELAANPADSGLVRLAVNNPSSHR
jgi:hypothetical protein